MTTIAYRRGVIAADTGMCIADARTGQTRKIARSTKGLAGGAGTAAYVFKFLKWFEAGERGKPPEATSDEHSIDRSMVIRPGKPEVIECYEPEGMFLIDAEYYALGIGRDVALGAFFMQADPLDAVRASMLHNTETWGELQWLTFEGDGHGRHRTHTPRLKRQSQGAGSAKAKKGTANR